MTTEQLASTPQDFQRIHAFIQETYPMAKIQTNEGYTMERLICSLLPPSCWILDVEIFNLLIHFRYCEKTDAFYRRKFFMVFSEVRENGQRLCMSEGQFQDVDTVEQLIRSFVSHKLGVIKEPQTQGN